MVVIESGKDRFGKPCSFYMDGTLVRELTPIKKLVTKKNHYYCTIVAGPPGCLTGDTLIQTDNGNKSLKELSNKTIFVKSYDFKKDNIIDGEAYVFPTGKKEVYEIETKDGRKIQATKDGRFNST